MPVSSGWRKIWNGNAENPINTLNGTVTSSSYLGLVTIKLFLRLVNGE